MASKQARSPARRAGRVLFRILAVLSAIIVALFCAYKLISRPPTMAAAPTPTPPPASEVNPAAPETPAPSHGGDEEVQQPPDNTPVRREGVYTFLLAATDQVGGNTDTIMVCTYDTVEQKVGLVSIPRDTLVREGKINSLYHKGIDTLKNAVSSLLGIPIDHYVTVNTRGFVKIINAVDGVDFNVPVRMAYDDPTQDLHIHFEKGMQHLTGEEALLVARCRKNSDGPGEYPDNLYDAYPDADIGRTRTQQQLITTVVKKILSRPNKLPEVVSTLTEYVDTDLSVSNILWLLEPALDLDFSSGISTATLAGDGNTYYPGWGYYCYQLYPEQTLEVVNTILNPYDRDLTLDNLNIFQYQ